VSAPTPRAWAMDIADEIVVSEGLAPSSERDLLEKIATALDAERGAVVSWLREQRAYGTDELLGQGFANVCGILADEIERGEHRRKETK